MGAIQVNLHSEVGLNTKHTYQFVRICSSQSPESQNRPSNTYFVSFNFLVLSSQNNVIFKLLALFTTVKCSHSKVVAANLTQNFPRLCETHQITFNGSQWRTAIYCGLWMIRSRISARSGYFVGL